MTNQASTATEAGLLSEETLEALANSISMSNADDEDIVTEKKQRKPRDYNAEIATLKNHIKELERKLTNTETQVRVYRDKVPDALVKANTLLLKGISDTAATLANASAGLLQHHDLICAITNSKLSVQNQKLIIIK